MNVSKIKVNCRNCDKFLGENSFALHAKYFKGADEEGKRKLFCSEKCFEEYKNTFYVEIYNKNTIYKITNEKGIWFIPYWDCRYAFKTLQDCKARIDQKNISYVDMEMVRALS